MNQGNRKINRNTRIIAIVLIAIIVVLAVSLIGCTTKLEILSHHMSWSSYYGCKVVKGKAKNASSFMLNYAEVRVNFYDVQGTLLESSLDNVNDLGPDETWSFEVLYFGPEPHKVRTYKIKVGSVF